MFRGSVKGFHFTSPPVRHRVPSYFNWSLPNATMFVPLSVRMCLEDFWILEPLKMEPICCPETSVRNYHYSLRNDPEGHSSYLLCGRSLKSRKKIPIWRILIENHVWEYFLIFVSYPIVWLIVIIIINSNLSNDRSKASYKTIPPRSAI